MVKETVMIVNKVGLHARPAALLFKTAGNFESRVSLIKNGRTFNARSMISIMSAAFKYGDEITVEVEGKDEERALPAITELIKSGFGEV